MYLRMNQYFRCKDAKNNFTKEDELSEEFKEHTEQLNVINKNNLCNISIVYQRKKDF